MGSLLDLFCAMMPETGGLGYHFEGFAELTLRVMQILQRFPQPIESLL
jgi:hypothetical protein